LPTLAPFEYPIGYIFAAADGEAAAADAAADGEAAAADAAAADGAGVELPEQAPTMTAIAARLAKLLVRLLRFMKSDSSILRPDALIWSPGPAKRVASLSRDRWITHLPVCRSHGRAAAHALGLLRPTWIGNA
jgi:hypothetical protein